MIAPTIPLFVVLTGVILILIGASAWAISAKRAREKLSAKIRAVASELDKKIDEDPNDVEFPLTSEPSLEQLGECFSKLHRLHSSSVQKHIRITEELEMLNLVAETVNRTLDLQAVFDTSLREALRTVSWDTGAIYMWDARSENFNMVSYVGLGEDTIREIMWYDMGEGLVGSVGFKREIAVVECAAQDTPKNNGHSWAGSETSIAIPLVAVPGQLLGVLCIANSTAKTPTENEIRLVKTVAHQIALAIDKAQLYTQATLRAEELERIVAARTEQLADAIESLSVALEKSKESEKLKSMLLSMVSHELRTPLATIKGSTSLLVEYYDRIDPDTQLVHLRDIDAETDKLTGLITDLLEMSRIQAGMLHIQPLTIDLAEVLRTAVASAKIRGAGRAYRLDIPNAVFPCIGDARRIEQIMANLLDNADKYSPKEGPIEVTLTDNSDQYLVCVIDKGQGIPDEHREEVFSEFFQVKSSRDAGRDGIGLGLAICRGLVEAHGGRIWVESGDEGGARFCFTLPKTNAMTVDED